MKATKRRNRRESGFTMVEMIAAMFLLTIGLMSLAGVLATVMNRQHYSQTVTNLTTLAQTTLENIKTQSYANITSSSEVFGSIAGFKYSQLQVTATPNAANDLLTIVVVATDHTGLSVSLQTVVAK
jgi:prepilin-type N-terminal cleavage/methylation domain-containing protein